MMVLCCCVTKKDKVAGSLDDFGGEKSFIDLGNLISLQHAWDMGHFTGFFARVEMEFPFRLARFLDGEVTRYDKKTLDRLPFPYRDQINQIIDKLGNASANVRATSGLLVITRTHAACHYPSPIF